MPRLTALFPTDLSELSRPFKINEKSVTVLPVQSTEKILASNHTLITLSDKNDILGYVKRARFRDGLAFGFL